MEIPALQPPPLPMEEASPLFCPLCLPFASRNAFPRKQGPYRAGWRAQPRPVACPSPQLAEPAAPQSDIGRPNLHTGMQSA